MSTMTDVVDDVRGFNRFYTRVLGLLRPELAGSAFGLTEARVLFEVAHRDDLAVSDLRRDRVGGQGEVGGRRASPGRPAHGRGQAGVRRAGPAAGSRHRHPAGAAR